MRRRFSSAGRNDHRELRYTIPMRINIVIDDDLMDDAMIASGLKTKRETVELGLKTLIQLKAQENIKRYKGKLKWEGSLEKMRTSW